MQWENIQVMNMVNFYNPTLEKVTIIHDNKKYRFEAEGYCKIPADAAQTIYEQWIGSGIFPIFENTDFEKAKRQGLLDYVKHGLDFRIEMFEVAIDERKRVGTLREDYQDPPKLKLWKKWREEILEILDAAEPLIPTPSYMDAMRENARENMNKVTEAPSFKKTSKKAEASSSVDALLA